MSTNKPLLITIKIISKIAEQNETNPNETFQFATPSKLSHIIQKKNKMKTCKGEENKWVWREVSSKAKSTNL